LQRFEPRLPEKVKCLKQNEIFAGLGEIPEAFLRASCLDQSTAANNPEANPNRPRGSIRGA
jgi:hypothetical protein